MKTAIIVTRILTGALLLFSASAYFFNLMPPQEMHGPSQQFLTGLFVSGYFMPLLKSLELICGIALVVGKFVPLATVVLFPITVNIFLFHAFLAPGEMLVSIFLLAANLFIAFGYRQNYRPLLSV
jgi:uncharacterized membrane protein YphA (DoxX/SURF4 family)